MRLWSVPTATGRVPEWLIDLAEGIAGVRPDGSRKFIQEQRFSLIALREESKSLQGTDFYSRFGRWFFADRDTRSSAPEP